MTVRDVEIAQLRKHAEALLREVDRNICEHEETYRGGVIWTICRSCGAKWADDEGGFQPHQDRPSVAAARAFLAEIDERRIERAPAVATGERTVRVRIAVAVDEIGRWYAAGSNGRLDQPLAQDALQYVSEPGCVSFVEATVPLPAEPATIAGTVVAREDGRERQIKARGGFQEEMLDCYGPMKEPPHAGTVVAREDG